MTFAKPLVIFTSLENLSPSAIDDLLDSVRNERQMNVYVIPYADIPCVEI